MHAQGLTSAAAATTQNFHRHAPAAGCRCSVCPFLADLAGDTPRRVDRKGARAPGAERLAVRALCRACRQPEHVARQIKPCVRYAITKHIHPALVFYLPTHDGPTRGTDEPAGRRAAGSRCFFLSTAAVLLSQAQQCPHNNRVLHWVRARRAAVFVLEPNIAHHLDVSAVRRAVGNNTERRGTRTLLFAAKAFFCEDRSRKIDRDLDPPLLISAHLAQPLRNWNLAATVGLVVVALLTAAPPLASIRIFLASSAALELVLPHAEDSVRGALCRAAHGDPGDVSQFASAPTS